MPYFIKEGLEKKCISEGSSYDQVMVLIGDYLRGTRTWSEVEEELRNSDYRGRLPLS